MSKNSRTVDVGDLVGNTELARMFGVGRSAVSNWATRRPDNGFPDPLVTLAMGPVYNRAEVLAWHREHVHRSGVDAAAG